VLDVCKLQPCSHAPCQGCQRGPAYEWLFCFHGSACTHAYRHAHTPHDFSSMNFFAQEIGRAMSSKAGACGHSHACVCAAMIRLICSPSLLTLAGPPTSSKPSATLSMPHPCTRSWSSGKAPQKALVRPGCYPSCRRCPSWWRWSLQVDPNWWRCHCRGAGAWVQAWTFQLVSVSLLGVCCPSVEHHAEYCIFNGCPARCESKKLETGQS